MGKGGGMSMPAAPNFHDATSMLRQQEYANTRAWNKNMKYNNIDSSSPFGSITYDRDRKGRPTHMNMELDPQSERIFNLGQDISEHLTGTALGRARQIADGGFTLAGLPYDPTAQNPYAGSQGFNPVSYGRDWQQNYQMAGQPDPGWGTPAPGGGGGGYGGGQGGGGQQGGWDQQRSGGLNPAWTEAKGQNDIAQGHWDAQGEGVLGGAERAKTEYQNYMNQKKDHFIKNRWSNADKFRKIFKKRFPNAKIKAKDSKGRIHWSIGDINQWEKSQRDKVAGEYEWGKPEEGFDAGYYGQQAGQEFGNDAEAWKHYVMQGREADTAFRGDFSAPNAELPDKYLPGPSHSTQVPYGQSPTQPGAGQVGGAPQQPQVGGGMPQGSVAGGGMPGPATSGPAPQQQGQPYNPNPSDPIGMPFPTTDANTMPYDPRSYGNMDMYEDRVGQAYHQNQMSMLQPQIEQQYDQQYQKLKDMGLPVGGEAWNKAVANLNRGVGQQLQQATNQATQMAGAEASRQLGAEQGLRAGAWNEATQLYGMNKGAEQDAFQRKQALRALARDERLLERNQNVNELAMMLGAAPQMPTHQGPGFQPQTFQASQPAQYMNNYNQTQLGLYNTQMQAAMASQQAQSAAMGQMFSGLGSLATLGKG